MDNLTSLLEISAVHDYQNMVLALFGKIYFNFVCKFVSTYSTFKIKFMTESFSITITIQRVKLKLECVAIYL